jgi:hypothetical protein
MAIEEQQIIDAVIARLGGISVTGGYLTDIGDKVEDSRPNWDEEDFPAISVFEGTVESSPYGDQGLTVSRTMPVMIKCFLKRQNTSALDAANARKAMADIFKAIRNDDTWIVSGERLARHTLEKSHGIEYAEGTFEITGCQVEIEIEYFGGKFNLEGD